MEREIYSVDLKNFYNLVGFGPAVGNNGKPPLVVILQENDYILTCEYLTDDRVGNKADIYFPKRNYILENEFESVSLHFYVNRLLKANIEFVLDVGEGWTDERSFVWTKREKNFLSNEIDLHRSVNIKNLMDIARVRQVYNELEICYALKNVEAVKQDQKIKQYIKEDLTTQIAKFFEQETSYAKVNRSTGKRKNLDQLDGTFLD